MSKQKAQDNQEAASPLSAGTGVRRLGQFEISYEVINRPDDFKLYDLFSNMVVLRAESLYHKQCIKYVAHSPLFEITPEGQMPLFYEIIWDGENSKWKVKAA